jgi:pyruvate kinase
MKKTKIVATLGPAVEVRGKNLRLGDDGYWAADLNKEKSATEFAKLIKAGLNVARFNFSHGDHAEQGDRLEVLHMAEKKTGTTIGVLLDTKGAEIRTTDQDTPTKKIEFKKGNKVRISMNGKLKGNKDKIAVTYPGLYNDVHVGGKILFDDGLIEMTIKEKDSRNKELIAIVDNDGTLGSKKGVNAPGVSINLPGITAKDKDDILFGLDQGISYIAASFVRKPKDILDIRKLLKQKNQEQVQIFPKIESQEGIDNFEAIMEVSDGLMVPRGDMGVEIPAEQVPVIQKHMIRYLNKLGKPVITATQMLDSMIENPRPTRAEISDVENAVWDGTDATMLSGESANGAWPVEAVTTMATANEYAEDNVHEYGHRINLRNEPTASVTDALAQAAVDAARDSGAKVIVASTTSGYTARLISKYRPDQTILAITYDENTQRGLTVNYAVHPVVEKAPKTTDEMIELAKKSVVSNKLAKKGDTIVITAGLPLDKPGTTNLIHVVKI